ncbi:ATP-binding protein [Curtanaerobium respiraculi]|uniref:ATP-binding protein n=1 Tax=Curtanaerobium respiraculi TaxID=2949669 RepID=UPI0024B34C43|nr:ATP-binding protein [Curtanaerobium respiraculi]
MDETRYLDDLIGRLRKVGTDVERVEVKESVGKLPSSMVETLSAFSNGSGGSIVLGLSEKNGFQPASGFEAKRIANALAGACSDKMSPPVRAHIEILPFEGSLVVLASVPEVAPRDKPVYVTERGMHEGSYVRSFDGDRHLSPYEIDRLTENKYQPSFDAEIVPNARMDDLDGNLVAEVLERQRMLHPRVFASISEEDALVDLVVAARDQSGQLRPTLAGLLALGRYPQKYYPQLTVSFTCYPGVAKTSAEKVKYLDSETMAGPIPQIIHDTIMAVRRNSRTRSILRDRARVDVPDYPTDAVREAVCNALMHRDYSPMGRGTQVQVNLYSDRMEVLSPGGLYGTVTVDTIGSAGYSSTRNQHLSALLETTPFEGGFVAESRGTGFQLIETLLRERGMGGPVVADSISMFSIVLRKSAPTIPPGEAVRNGRGSGADRVLGYLEAHGESSSAEIAQALGMPRSTVNYQLKKLVERDVVERIGELRSSRQSYRLNG